MYEVTDRRPWTPASVTCPPEHCWRTLQMITSEPVLGGSRQYGERLHLSIFPRYSSVNDSYVAAIRRRGQARVQRLD